MVAVAIGFITVLRASGANSGSHPQLVEDPHSHARARARWCGRTDERRPRLPNCTTARYPGLFPSSRLHVHLSIHHSSIRLQQYCDDLLMMMVLMMMMTPYANTR
jgi:hypothetical protein